MRALRHLFDAGSVRRRFPPRTLDAIQHAIAASEQRQPGEIVFAVEGALGLPALWRRRSARERAHEVFAHLRVWNTQHDTGVLIYVLLADRAIEIVADRGIAARVDASQWQAVCDLMRQHFSTGHYEAGALAGVAAVSTLIEHHFPGCTGGGSDELPNRPVLL